MLRPANTAAWRLEKRVTDGAAVQPGKLDLYTSGVDEMPPEPPSGLGIDNLTIGAPEHIRRLKDAKAKAEADAEFHRRPADAPASPSPQELYRLFRRVVDNANVEDRDHLCEFLAASRELPCVEAALRSSTHHYGIFPPVDDLVAEGKDGRTAMILRGASMITMRQDWLTRVFELMAYRLVKGARPTPDDVMAIIAEEANEMDCDLETARQVLASHAAALAPEIRAAAQKLEQGK